MKTAIYRQTTNIRAGIPFPNAAASKKSLQKLLDWVLVGAIGLGLATSILFLLTIS